VSRGGALGSEGSQDITTCPAAVLFLSQTIGPLRVYVVDGTMIRNHVYLDFTEGGNSHAYPWMPPYTIWLDNANSAEFHAILLHELSEYNFMGLDGMSYDDAHDHANELEHRARQNPHEYQAIFDYQVERLLGRGARPALAKVRNAAS
jgi:hypothetical protein